MYLGAGGCVGCTGGKYLGCGGLVGGGIYCGRGVCGGNGISGLGYEYPFVGCRG